MIISRPGAIGPQSGTADVAPPASFALAAAFALLAGRRMTGMLTRRSGVWDRASDKVLATAALHHSV
jgi:hypothetical protein